MVLRNQTHQHDSRFCISESWLEYPLQPGQGSADEASRIAGRHGQRNRDALAVLWILHSEWTGADINLNGAGEGCLLAQFDGCAGGVTGD